jgi:hypothetical protein
MRLYVQVTSDLPARPEANMRFERGPHIHNHIAHTRPFRVPLIYQGQRNP